MIDIQTEVELPVILPDPRPSDPLEALSWLGVTEEEVVRSLRERGIKGAKSYTHSCPLARFLQNWWDTAWAGPTDISSGVCVWPILRQNTPDYLRHFMSHFDNGLYPDLIADD